MATSVVPSFVGKEIGGLRLDVDRSHIRSIKVVLLDLGTTDTSATVAVTLTDYGIKNLLGITGSLHSTLNSVLVNEAPHTAVANGVLTITVGGTALTGVRTYLLIGEEV